MAEEGQDKLEIGIRENPQQSTSLHSRRLSDIGCVVLENTNITKYHAPYITQAAAMHSSATAFI